jgi:hypothetical protein
MMKWISVKEQEPELERPVIIWNERMKKYAIDRWVNGISSGHRCWAMHSKENITYWMIPDPPTHGTITMTGDADIKTQEQAEIENLKEEVAALKNSIRTINREIVEYVKEEMNKATDPRLHNWKDPHSM